MGKVIPLFKDNSICHIAGVCLTADGHRRRQVCSWCGEILVDDDTNLMATKEGTESNLEGWGVGTWVAVDGGVSWVVTPEEGKYPDNACMRKAPVDTQPDPDKAGA